MSKTQLSEHEQPKIAISRSRKRAFFIVTAVTPLLAIVLLELGLRSFGYGPNIALFTTEEVGGKTYHIMNPDVKFRYFSHVTFSPNTSPDYFIVPKPKGTFRIFSLGASTTIGFPYGPVGSFSTFLRDRLQTIFPLKRIEIINLGMTATNSYTAADISHDLMDYEPDLIIDYDGHNEFYGALGVASNETAGGSRFLTKLYLRLVHYRTFFLLRSGLDKLRAALQSTTPTDNNGTLMERLSRGQYVLLNSPEHRRGLEIFRSNLDELRETCVSHGIPLIFSPQVSNLRDQPPFVSEFNPGLSDEAKSKFDYDFDNGITYWREGMIDSAGVEFRSAMALDSGRADAHYLYARCLDSLGQMDNAKNEYTRARDLDQLRFRASTDFNDAIKETAHGPGVYFAPLEEMMAQRSKGGIIGKNLILEHLHPRLEGNFFFAKEYARIMRDNALLATPQEWMRDDTVADERLWNDRILTTVDELAAEVRVARLTSEWPFKHAFSVPDSLLLNGPMGKIIDPFVKGQATWERTHVAAAEYFEKSGDFQGAEKEYRVLINQLPYNISAYLLLGQLYGAEKKLEKAREILVTSLAVEPSFEAYQLLGKIQLIDNRPLEAIPYLEHSYSMSRTPDQRTSAGFFLALSQVKTGKIAEAKSLLNEVLKINPTLKDARALLNSISNQPS